MSKASYYLAKFLDNLFNRGDLASTTLMFDCFWKFSNVPGLTANQVKSNMYFGRVTEVTHQLILQYTDFKKGSLPFEYLDNLCAQKSYQ